MAAIQGTKELNLYIQPKVPISPDASRVTGITVANGIMKHNGQTVQCVPIMIALGKLKEFLSPHGAVLVGHNVKNFDCKVLYNAVVNNKMNEELSPFIKGFLDTLCLFKGLHPGLDSYKQENLVKEFVKTSYNAHDALADVRALESLMGTITNDKMFDYSFSWNYVSSMVEFNKMKATNVSFLNTMIEKKVLSRHMAEKMAGSGLSYSHLALAHQRCSEQGICTLMSERGMLGKPRVTCSKKIILNVTEYFKGIPSTSG